MRLRGGTVGPRARAIEVMLSAQDYNAELAERYGWINRALPADTLGEFVRSLAHRIAKFPARSLAAVKDRVNAIALAPVEDFRHDSDLFGEGARTPSISLAMGSDDLRRLPYRCASRISRDWRREPRIPRSPIFLALELCDHSSGAIMPRHAREVYAKVYVGGPPPIDATYGVSDISGSLARMNLALDVAGLSPRFEN